MKLRSLGEMELIAGIRKDFSKAGGKRPLLGIGDDAAVIRAGKIPVCLTKDLLVEKVDFSRRLHPPFFLGRKSLNVNLSDIAAMGGIPRFALLGLALPSGIMLAWVEEFFRGFKSAAEEAQVSLIGGDISRASEVLISVTVVGEGKAFIRRYGGRAGDHLYISGYPGQAAAGLSLLRKGYGMGKDRDADVLLKSFLDPVPQLALGREIARRRLASAMIDTSDGLSLDLLRLCRESGTGAEVEREKLPLSEEIRRFSRNPLRPALHGGEDFGLLLAVPPGKETELLKLAKKHRLTRIGRMTRGKKILMVDGKGKKSPLKIKGYQHFRS